MTKNIAAVFEVVLVRMGSKTMQAFKEVVCIVQLSVCVVCVYVIKLTLVYVLESTFV